MNRNGKNSFTFYQTHSLLEVFYETYHAIFTLLSPAPHPTVRTVAASVGKLTLIKRPHPIIIHFLKEDFSFGKRLKEEISYQDIPHFILTPNERCPFLNHQNLCDIYIHLGEKHLCEICTQHPRFHEWFGDYKESGLGLCCEEAARLLLSSPEPLTFRTTVIEEEEDKTPFDKVLLDQLLCLRKEMFALLQDRTKTFSSRLSSLLFLAEQAQQQLDNGDLPFSFSQTPCFSTFGTNPVENLDLLLSFLQTLEPIDLGWPDRLSCIQKELPVLLSNREQFLSALHERMYEYEHLCVYFLYRYLLKATCDEDILSRVIFAVFSVSIIFLLGLFMIFPKMDNIPFPIKFKTPKHTPKKSNTATKIWSLFWNKAGICQPFPPLH